MRDIQIGIEVHKAIEAERRSLEETENEILMRLLKVKPAADAVRPSSRPIGASWTKDGVELPEGTLLRVVYSGQEVQGMVQDGRWVINGQAYSSPSMALIHNVRTHAGKQTNLNGWNHWTAKRPGDSSYRRIGDLRATARRR